MKSTRANAAGSIVRTVITGGIGAAMMMASTGCGSAGAMLTSQVGQHLTSAIPLPGVGPIGQMVFQHAAQAGAQEAARQYNEAQIAAMRAQHFQE